MSNKPTIQTLNMSFQNMSDDENDEVTDILLDTDRNTSEPVDNDNDEEEQDNTIEGLDTARMELPEFEEDLPPIMAKILEQKRLDHALVGANNRQDLELTADDYALPSSTPRQVSENDYNNNSFEDSLLADFEMKPESLLVQPPQQHTFSKQTTNTSSTKTTLTTKSIQKDETDSTTKQASQDTELLPQTIKAKKKKSINIEQPINNKKDKKDKKDGRYSKKGNNSTKNNNNADNNNNKNNDKNNVNDNDNKKDNNNIDHKELIRTTQSKLSELEKQVLLRENENLQHDKQNAKNAIQNLESEIERIDDIDRRASNAIEIEKKNKMEMEMELKKEKKVARDRIQERIQRNKDAKHRKKEAVRHKTDQNVEHAASTIQKAFRKKQSYKQRVDQQIKLEKENEKEIKEIVEKDKNEEHNRIQARLKRKQVKRQAAKEHQAELFGDKGIPELEQELLASSQVRKRLEKEISQLREEFIEKEKKMVELQNETKQKELLISNERKETLKHANAGQKESNKLIAMKEEIDELRKTLATRNSAPDDMSELQDHLEHISSENRRLLKKVEEKNTNIKKLEELHARNQRTWQVRLKAMQNKPNVVEGIQKENDTYKDNIITLQDQISNLRHVNREMRMEKMGTDKLSNQMRRAKDLLIQERRKRSNQFVVVHIGNVLRQQTKTQSKKEMNVLKMKQLHDPTHIIRKNVIFEMSSTAMLEDTVGYDMGEDEHVEKEDDDEDGNGNGKKTTTTGLPTQKGLCGALMAGQCVRLGAVYGGWACLEAPFQGSWINIAALGENGIDRIGKDGQIFNNRNQFTMDIDELKTSRDQVAVLIHQVQTLENLSEKGQRVLAKLSSETNVSLRSHHSSTIMDRSSNKTRIEYDTNTNTNTTNKNNPNDQRILKHLSNLFNQVSEEMNSLSKSIHVQHSRSHLKQIKSKNNHHSVPNLHTNKTNGFGLGSTKRDSWLRKQEQNGVWAVPPLELAKRTSARRKKKQMQSDILSGSNTSEQLLHLFAKLHTAAIKIENEKENGNGYGYENENENENSNQTKGGLLTWVNSKLPLRIFYICRKETTSVAIEENNTEGSVLDSSTRQQRQRRNRSSRYGTKKKGISECVVTVYHFPLDGNPADLDGGTKIFHGQTDLSGRVTCRVSPGIYMIVVLLPYTSGTTHSGGYEVDDDDEKEDNNKRRNQSRNQEKRMMIVVDPARGHLDKSSVVVPIEV